MGNIFEDIVEDMPITPSKSKLVLKWVVRVAVMLICGAFVFGQVKIKTLNNAINVQKSLDDNTKAITVLNNKMDNSFNIVNNRIDKVYDDGNKIFTDYVNYNKEQLKIIIDYGQTNKNMLKRMLDLNALEKSQSVENRVGQAKESSKKDTIVYNRNIIIQPLK